jgi:tetratricopeptide (TPR) repeat protein
MKKVRSRNGVTQPDVSTILLEGMKFHQQDSLDQAERCYEDILTKQPDHADAKHLLGVLRFQQGRYDEAAALIRAALKTHPASVPALTNMGNVLSKLGRLEEALASYGKALAIGPEHVEALNGRGNVQRELGLQEEALISYGKALAIKPDYADAACNRGMALQDLDRPEDALASYDKALAVKPNHAEAACNRGIALQDLKRPEEALASYDKALAIKPDYAEAAFNRGNALMDLGRLEQALASYGKALKIKPHYAEALNNRGSALKRLNRPGEALESFDKALAIKPDYAAALNNRGITLGELERLGEALESFDKALAIEPDYADALNNRGVTLRELKLIGEALDSFDKALAVKPGWAEAAFSKSICLLLGGRFEDGWLLYESRKKVAGNVRHFSSRSFPQQQWSGEKSLGGKTLFIHWEQGFGDTIQFCRFAKLAEQRGAKVVFSVQNRLYRLLQALSPTIEFIDETQAPAEFDYYCPLLSLPLAFQTTLDSIPGDAQYLRAEPDRVRKWRDKLGDEGFKIGIAWQGSKNKVDAGRSFRPAEFLGVSRAPNVRLISLQKSNGSEHLRDLPQGMKVESLGEDFDAGGDAFLDTAAVMENLDLVITSDTSAAHLAGALGRPVWVALKHVPDWRWMLDRVDSPWYPTMRLFRQQARGDWKGVFLEIEKALNELTSANREQANTKLT